MHALSIRKAIYGEQFAAVARSYSSLVQQIQAKAYYWKALNKHQ